MRLLLFFLLTTATLAAQSTQHFRGRIDGFADVALSIACQAGKCTGTLTYLRSETTLPLSGTRVEGQYQLRELDDTGTVSGYLSGTQTDDQLLIHWTDPQRTRRSEWRLQRIQQPRTIPTDCGDDKWWRAYRAEDVFLLLQKADNRGLRGHWYQGDCTYALRSVAADENRLRLELIDDRGSRVGLLLLPVNFTDNELRVDYLSTDGTQRTFTLEASETLAAHCEAYADYHTRYELLYPAHPSAGFGAYLQRLTDSWLRECRRRATLVAAKTDPVAAERATARAYAHTDLIYADEKLLSGLITFDHSWRKGTNTIAFNYDLTADAPLDLYDLIRPNHGFEDYLTGQVRRYFRDHELARTDAGFRDWIESNSFAHWTIRPDGLAFHTGYSTLYGRHSLVLSYKKLKPYLRKDAAVRRFAR